MRRLFALLRGRPRRREPVPIDSERLLRIYRETHRQVEDLRRAA
ncbi:MAG TPA: hypothetical protein VHZ77_06355 [Gaiellaceae bacterium]|jgi:hypothetical protein|nr:hypothetical protein [Gaiellaceae bacterium]